MRLVSESNEHLIGFIASTVEKLRDDVGILRVDVENIRRDMATQADLMATQSDLMATKADLALLEGKLSERIETDLNRLEGKLAERIEVNTTSIRGDIEQVQLRLDTMEHSVSSRFEHVEGEISRLRSAVYLLGRDRPDVLRLLGQINPN